MSDIGTDGPPPFIRLGPVDAATPLVLAVPHAGRHYPAALDASRTVPRRVLEELEDRYADRLVTEAVRGGAVAIVATFARAWIDLNRGAEDGIGAGGSARARAGLGLIPDRLGGRPLWHRAPDAAEGAERLDRIHLPYHAAIAAALEAAHARHGFAVLIDCHSMPPLRRGDGAPQIVLGDRHGTSAGWQIAAAAGQAARAHGHRPAHNAPYAGAYTLERHGRPEAGVHALQVEVDRRLYLERRLAEPSAALGDVARLIADMAWAATEASAPVALAQAAE